MYLADLYAMLCSHPMASVDDISAESAVANHWALHMAREARAHLGAMPIIKIPYLKSFDVCCRHSWTKLML